MSQTTHPITNLCNARDLLVLHSRIKKPTRLNLANFIGEAFAPLLAEHGNHLVVARAVASGRNRQGELGNQGENNPSADTTRRRIEKMLSKGLRSHNSWRDFATPARTAAVLGRR